MNMARLRKKYLLSFIIATLIVFIVLYRKTNIKWLAASRAQIIPAKMRSVDSEVSIAVVVCGERLKEALTMIKSAIISNDVKTFLNFRIVTEDILKQNFMDQLVEWQRIIPDQFSFNLYSLHFPKSNENNWRNLFKLCAAQRLFLPSLLHNIDATIYVDTDIVFLSPPIDLWSHFDSFNASHINGLSPEHEDTNIGWYNRFARHPFFGALGVNSGVMLMNLTRMRKINWENKIFPLYKQYKSKITWGDQDLINIFFYFNPDKLYLFPCMYNYRPDHCMYMNVCNITQGIRIIHGNRGYFHSNKQLFFKYVYQAFTFITIKSDVTENFSNHLKQLLKTKLLNTSSCSKIINHIGYHTKLT